MSEEQGPLYRLLKWIAISGAVLWLGYEAYSHFARMAPGDVSYIDGNSLFSGGLYERAAAKYEEALEDNPRHLPAMRALANSYVQTKNFEKALTAIQHAIRVDPNFGGNYAIRGIIYDHLGDYKQAIQDYERAVELFPEVKEGMHWLDKLLYGVYDDPPTVDKRLAYLKEQMKLPEAERVLRIPEIDDKQRPYEQ
ncbi:MAG: tetratricopeptide repeat protein [Hyphomicrobiaceae bacterium]|nr:tetratricopeptide repeat protein [Hyphomicrobiaceae bacterium]